MIELVLAALGLALAGLDPAGALIAAGALGGGARERNVAVYGLVMLLGTVAFGTALSLTLGPRIAGIDWSFLVPGDRTAALIETVLGIGLVVWGIVRAQTCHPCAEAAFTAGNKPDGSLRRRTTLCPFGDP